MSPQDHETGFARGLREARERYDREDALYALNRIASNQETPWRPLPPPAPAADNTGLGLICGTVLLLALLAAACFLKRRKEGSEEGS